MVPAYNKIWGEDRPWLRAESLVSCLRCAEAAAPEFAAAPEKEERLGAGGGAGHALAGQQVLAAAVRARGADPAWGEILNFDIHILI